MSETGESILIAALELPIDDRVKIAANCSKRYRKMIPS